MQIESLSNAETSSDKKYDKLNTWNIIFLAVHIRDGNEAKIKVIEDGVTAFQNAVLKTPYSENIKINILVFNSSAPKGTAQRVFSIQNPENSTTFSLEMENPMEFDCHINDYYTKYLSSVKGNVGEKTMVIFLAHSFGTGFLKHTPPHDPLSPSGDIPLLGSSVPHADPKPIVFSVKNLNFCIGESLGRIDCLFAVNCAIQSIETNCIFSDHVSLLIASQQTLMEKAIFYEKLLTDLSTYSHNELSTDKDSLSDEHIFTKFILDSHAFFAKNDLSQSVGFSLTLSKPAKAKYFLSLFTLFAATIETREFEYINKAKDYCLDPDTSRSVNILDARQFFEKLLEYMKIFAPLKSRAIEIMLSRLKEIVVFHLASGNTCGEFGPPLPGLSNCIFLSRGLGLFLIKVSSDRSEISLKIMEDLHDLAIGLPFEEWLDIVIGENSHSTNAIELISTKILGRNKMLPKTAYNIIKANKVEIESFLSRIRLYKN